MTTQPTQFQIYPAPEQLPTEQFDFIGAPTTRAIYEAFLAANRARCTLFDCIEAEQAAKNALAERKIDLMTSGQIEGKNAEQREALLLARTAAERATLREAEAATRLATLKLEEAQGLSRTYEWMTLERQRRALQSLFERFDFDKNGELVSLIPREWARDAFGELSVALTREEVAVLRVLIAPPVTDKQLNKLLIGLDAVAREYDRNTWGIPLVDKKPRLAMHKVIRDWLATLNQPPATNN